MDDTSLSNGSAERPFSALVILPSRIGDAILTSGVLRHIRETHPRAAFTIATSRLAASLFAELRDLDRLIPHDRKRLKAHWFALLPKVFRRWDLVVDMRGSPMSLLTPSRRRLSHRSSPPTERGEHRVVVAARVVSRSDRPPDPLIECSPETDARAQQLLAGAATPLAFSPGASWQGKVWPAENFVDLAAALMTQSPHLRAERLMIVGGPDEDALTEPLRRRLGADRVIDLVGLDLVATFACLKRARLFVGNDSGMMHLAAAAGAPTLGLFGPTSEALYRPWGRHTATVRAPGSQPRAGVAKRGFDMSLNYMQDLDVAVVLNAAESLLDATAALFRPKADAVQTG